MTRALILAIRDTRGGQLFAAIAGLTLLPVAIVVDIVGALRWRWRVRALLARTETRCPVGHPVGLTGVWSCGCGTTFDGHGFQDCPACGTRSNVSCACSRTCPNPLGASKPQ